MIRKIFLKKEDFNAEMLADNLFISKDSDSALKHDNDKVLKLLKVYNEMQIINKRHKVLAEGYSEDIYIVNCQNEIETKIYFVRLIIDNSKLSDILVYSLGNNFSDSEYNINFYRGVFLNTQNFTPSEDFLRYYNCLTNNKLCFTIENNHFKLIHETNKFLNLIGYEDWDFENKYQNYLDMILDIETVRGINNGLDKSDVIKLNFNNNVINKCSFIAKLEKKIFEEITIYFLIFE